ncbi:FAD-dependent oxidoreductase [Sagittula sp. M10.9X]|uniref:FAD-dependent oxidoreductase n=1 Tax=Sagittula salina TaxID=2820268 RepID=A0A940S2D3_9RHOB|nr:FAD-dependent oxidoreductase [Sagittula salina]
MTAIMIIGAGECGVRTAFALREQGFDGTVTLIGAETALPCERPPLSKDPSAAPRPIRPEAAYAEQGIDLRLGFRCRASTRRAVPRSWATARRWAMTNCSWQPARAPGCFRGWRVA